MVLDMGEPVKIVDLAKKMIHLSGLSYKENPYSSGDIEIQYTGLRPGEKLYEELLIGDNPKPTTHPRIMKSHEDFIIWDDLQKHLESLEIALSLNDVEAIRMNMKNLVFGYTPNNEIVDWVHLEQEAEVNILS